jgi:hypothetical protein
MREDQAQASCQYRPLHFGANTIAEADGEDLALQMSSGAAHLFDKALKVFHCQVELDFADDPHGDVGLRWFMRLAKKINLFFLAIPHWPAMGEWPHLPAKLAHQNVCEHAKGHILQVAAHSITHATYLLAQFLKRSFCLPLGSGEILLRRGEIALCYCQLLDALFSALQEGIS